jgi:hypothetical protein
MNRAGKVFLPVLFAFLVALWPTPGNAAAVSFDLFYSNLSPHGSWLVSAQFGHVWQPRAYAAGWNPYYDGHWVDSDLGWTWVSDYSWGSIPYHYGTWVWDPALGWVWIPGYVWAPSWVVFRTGPDFIGWAPVSPGFSVGVSAGFAAPAGPFVFVSAHDFLAPHVRTFVVPENRARILVGQTRVVNSLTVENNVVVNRGPDHRMVERATGRKIDQVPIDRVPRVAPAPRVDRAALEVRSSRSSRGLRAADPVPASQPLPGARRMAVSHEPASHAAPQEQARPRQADQHVPPNGHAAAPPRPTGNGRSVPPPAPVRHAAPQHHHGQEPQHHE